MEDSLTKILHKKTLFLTGASCGGGGGWRGPRLPGPGPAAAAATPAPAAAGRPAGGGRAAGRGQGLTSGLGGAPLPLAECRGQKHRRMSVGTSKGLRVRDFDRLGPPTHPGGNTPTRGAGPADLLSRVRYWGPKNWHFVMELEETWGTHWAQPHPPWSEGGGSGAPTDAAPSPDPTIKKNLLQCRNVGKFCNHFYYSFSNYFFRVLSHVLIGFLQRCIPAPFLHDVPQISPIWSWGGGDGRIVRWGDLQTPQTMECLTSDPGPGSPPPSPLGGVAEPWTAPSSGRQCRGGNGVDQWTSQWRGRVWVSVQIRTEKTNGAILRIPFRHIQNHKSAGREKWATNSKFSRQKQDLGRKKTQKQQKMIFRPFCFRPRWSHRPSVGRPFAQGALVKKKFT